MTQRMAEVGADAMLVTTPCFYKGSMTNDALCAHYSKVNVVQNDWITFQGGFNLNSDGVQKLTQALFFSGTLPMFLLPENPCRIP